MDAILLIGQSNMAGRGIIGDVPEIDPLGRMFMLRSGCWQPMSEPINPDRRIFVQDRAQLRSGVSLAASFAQRYVEAHDQPVGLIPCAYGGSCMDDWAEGRVLFRHAVMQTQLALYSSRLCGILWHQGESDSKRPEHVATYAEKFDRFIDALARSIGAGRVPIVLGELSEDVPRYPLAGGLNAALRGIAASRADCGIATSAGLSIGPDGMHFTAASYRLLGERYFQAYQCVRARL